MTSPVQVLDLPDGRAHYRIREGGAPDATPILLLHGSLLQMDSWDQVLERIPDRTFVLLDLPGHGRTSVLEGDDYSTAAQLRFVTDFVEELYPNRALTIAGHSMGGHVAWRFAIHEPRRTARLILIDSAGLAHPTGPQAAAYAIVANHGVAAFADTLTRDVFARALVANTYDGSPITRDLLDDYWQFLSDPFVRIRSFRRFTTPTVEAAEVARLGEIAAPTLLLWGSDDPVYSIEIGKGFEALIPNAVLRVYDECGHLPNFERPDALASDIATFTG